MSKRQTPPIGVRRIRRVGAEALGEPIGEALVVGLSMRGVVGGMGHSRRRRGRWRWRRGGSLAPVAGETLELSRGVAVLRVGAPVEFNISGYDGQGFTGHIERINPSVDPGARLVRLTVSIPNAGRALVAGLFAKGRVAAEEKLAPAVPLAVVDQRGPAPTVRRIHEGRVEVVAVQHPIFLWFSIISKNLRILPRNLAGPGRSKS